MVSMRFAPIYEYVNIDRMTSICEYATKFLGVISKKTCLSFKRDVIWISKNSNKLTELMIL